MYYVNHYMSYSDTAKNLLVDKGIAKKHANPIGLMAIDVLAALIVEAPLKSLQGLQDKVKGTEWEARMTNAKSLLVNGFTRTRHPLFLKAFLEGERYRVDKTTSCIEILDLLYTYMVEEHKNGEGEELKSLFHQFLIQSMLTSKYNEDLYSLLEEHILEEGNEHTEVHKGYYGVAVPYVLKAIAVMQLAEYKNFLTINRFSTDKEEIKDILNYNLGLCIKERNTSGLVLLLMIAYAESDYNLMAIGKSSVR